MRLIDADEFFKDFTELEPYEHISHEYDIDAEPIKIGHWIEKGKGIAECDVCNQQNLYRQDGVGVCTKYCPSCGARMEW